MSVLMEVSGAVVSTVVSAYDFTDDSGRHVAGETLVVWFEQGPEAAPGEVKTKDRALFDQIRKAGPGTEWSFRCDAKAFGNKLSMQVVAATPLARPVPVAKVA